MSKRISQAKMRIKIDLLRIINYTNYKPSSGDIEKQKDYFLLMKLYDELTDYCAEEKKYYEKHWWKDGNND